MVHINLASSSAVQNIHDDLSSLNLGIEEATALEIRCKIGLSGDRRLRTVLHS